jgi:hypothetical protein
MRKNSDSSKEIQAGSFFPAIITEICFQIQKKTAAGEYSSRCKSYRFAFLLSEGRYYIGARQPEA